MSAKDDLPPAATGSEIAPTRASISDRVLDPVSRASEFLFGLIMVLTFTLSLTATESDRADVRAVLIGMLGAISPGPSSMPSCT